jgi:hypothetical protein
MAVFRFWAVVDIEVDQVELRSRGVFSIRAEASVLKADDIELAVADCVFDCGFLAVSSLAVEV